MISKKVCIIVSHVSVVTEARTPEVPSGGCFYARTRACFMKTSDPLETRLLVTTKVEFTKSTWLKGPIERGTVEGNSAFYNALLPELCRKLGEGASAVKKAPKKRPASPCKPLPQTPECLPTIIADSPWPTLYQIALGVIVVLCVFANIWCWIRVMSLQQITTQSNEMLNAQMFMAGGFSGMSESNRKIFNENVNRLKVIEQRMEQVAQTMEAAEIELATLARELEAERRGLSEVMLKAMKQEL